MDAEAEAEDDMELDNEAMDTEVVAPEEEGSKDKEQDKEEDKEKPRVGKSGKVPPMRRQWTHTDVDTGIKETRLHRKDVENDKSEAPGPVVAEKEEAEVKSTRKNRRRSTSKKPTPKKQAREEVMEEAEAETQEVGTLDEKEVANARQLLENLPKMKVKDLQKNLKKKGLNTKGRKAELAARLQEELERIAA